MANNTQFVQVLGARLRYESNRADKSYYKKFKMFNGEKDRQIRVSDHGTYLRTWMEQDYDPTFSINISIVFKGENGLTNDCFIDNATNKPYSDCVPCLYNQELVGKVCKPRKVENYSQKKRPFFVTQYVYNCLNFDGSEIETLINAIKSAANSGIYTDPFINVEGKKAKMIELYPIQEQRYSNMKLIENKKQKYINMNTKANRIRLTEGQLHRVIKESIKNVIKENYTDEMAISKIQSGKNKGGVKMDADDYKVITKVYHDLIAAMEMNEEDWKGPLGEILNTIWRGPVQDLRQLLRNNSSLGEWQQINQGINNGW